MNVPGLPHFTHYVSLGDSISIDLYPALDIQEREGLPAPPPGLGAASLLHRNDDRRWQEFAGRDLATRFPGIQHLDLTEDGATTSSTLLWQVPRIPRNLEGPVLITLTAGGNDLLSLLGVELGRPATELEAPGHQAVAEVADTLGRILRGLKELLRDPVPLVGTVYDPTDGTGDLGDGLVRRRELGWLAAFNRRVEELAREEGALVAPIHCHFLGHGLSEPDPEARWYWRHMIIEPSARGASEVRRLWLEALGL